ncbi:MFS multidrug transporter [Hortaea werneckii]|nr:MFS multidrug transporter [Hortaea werneckii]
MAAPSTRPICNPNAASAPDPSPSPDSVSLFPRALRPYLLKARGKAARRLGSSVKLDSPRLPLPYLLRCRWCSVQQRRSRGRSQPCLLQVTPAYTRNETRDESDAGASCGEILHGLKMQRQVEHRSQPAPEREEIAEIASRHAAVEDDMARCEGLLGHFHLDQDEDEEERNRDADGDQGDGRFPTIVASTVHFFFQSTSSSCFGRCNAKVTAMNATRQSGTSPAAGTTSERRMETTVVMPPPPTPAKALAAISCRAGLTAEDIAELAIQGLEGGQSKEVGGGDPRRLVQGLELAADFPIATDDDGLVRGGQEDADAEGREDVGELGFHFGHAFVLLLAVFRAGLAFQARVCSGFAISFRTQRFAMGLDGGSIVVDVTI